MAAHVSGEAPVGARAHTMRKILAVAVRAWTSWDVWWGLKHAWLTG